MAPRWVGGLAGDLCDGGAWEPAAGAAGRGSSGAGGRGSLPKVASVAGDVLHGLRSPAPPRPSSSSRREWEGGPGSVTQSTPLGAGGTQQGT